MSARPPRLTLRGVVKRFAGVLANDHVDLTIAAGEIHALLGENGAGKSTLMQILYGLYQADAGQIEMDGARVTIRHPGDAIALGIGMVHQEFMLVQPMSVVENVVLGHERGRRALLDLKGAAKRLRDLSERHGLVVDPAARIDRLPIGVQQRVEILKLLYRDARVLILDEPTAVLSPQERDGLFATLRSLRAEGRSIIIVTHKLREITSVADRVSVMRGGRMIETVDVADTSERDLALRMVGRDVVLRVSKAPTTPGDVMLQIDQVSLRDEGGRQKLSNIDITVRAGEIVGIAGVEGNGQSELADALLNLRPISSGEIRLDGRDITNATPAQRRVAGVAFVPADRRGAGCVTALSITDNAALGDHKRYAKGWGASWRLWLDRKAMAAQASKIVAHYGVRAAGIALEAGKLSGGNLQKLILAREVLRAPKALIVEQPTRGLDVGAVEAVWSGLLAERDKRRAILMISAELEEIVNLSDRVAVMFEGRIVGVLESSEVTLERLAILMAGGQYAQAAAQK